MTQARPVAAATPGGWSRSRPMAAAALAVLGAAGAAALGTQLSIAGVVGDAARSALTDTSVLPLHVVLTLCAGALMFALARRYPTVVLKRTAFTLVAFAVITQALRVGAQDAAAPAAPVIDGTKVALDTIWTLIAGMLVFFMNRASHARNRPVPRQERGQHPGQELHRLRASSIAFWVAGFGMMFGDGNAFIGTAGALFVAGADNSPATGEAYQGVYIGAQLDRRAAGRSSSSSSSSPAPPPRSSRAPSPSASSSASFMIFSFLLVAFVYPVTGHWIWGGGWLGAARHRSTSPARPSCTRRRLGGAGGRLIVLGPRLGKYKADGKVNPIPGHSMGLGGDRLFILWLGWFGFNPGSTMTATGRSATSPSRPTRRPRRRRRGAHVTAWLCSASRTSA